MCLSAVMHLLKDFEYFLKHVIDFTVPVIDLLNDCREFLKEFIDFRKGFTIGSHRFP